MAGKAHSFHKCNCPGLDDEVDRLYRQIEQIDTDSKVDALQTGASPFDSILVGQDQASIGIDNINAYTLTTPSNETIGNGSSAKLTFNTLPVFLTTLKRGTGVLASSDDGMLSYPYGQDPDTGTPSNGLYIPTWTVVHADKTNDYNGTVECWCFNVSGASLTIKATDYNLLVFSPARI